MPLAQRDVADSFQRAFGQPPRWIVRAPGRVNLIGEHTDYNDGFVLPIAIDRAIWIALRPRTDGRVVVRSADYDQQGEFALEELSRGQPGWIEYLKGVAWTLQEAGHRLVGWEGVLAGDVPRGAGLSSSAALEVACARAFATTSELVWDPSVMAQLAQRAENRWVGVNCGIMDQLISATGQAGHAQLIDCRSLALQPVPLPPGVAVAVLDTGTRRGLVDSAYNERRAQGGQSAQRFAVKALRDVAPDEFARRSAELDESARRRARHVITENDRTLKAAEAMRRGDATELGRLMDQSHVSLRDDFEVSSDALNAMVEAAHNHPGCYGARMTGAGFGGCAVALVNAGVSDQFVATVADAYRARTGNKPAVYVCHATDGAEVVES